MALSRPLVVDDDHLGTPEAVWLASAAYRSRPVLDVVEWRRAVVVAPHPDDEVLGAGGLARALSDAGTEVSILAVTDGEGSHPGSPAAERLDLGAVRAAERAEALTRLGLAGAPVEALHLPDGGVTGRTAALVARLAADLGPADACLAPWERDGHPDHDACGRAAAAACEATGATLIGYLVWAWHWAGPDDLPRGACRRLDLDPVAVAAKRHALAAFDSQVRPLGPDRRDGPVLPPPVVARFTRPSETFVVRTAS